MQLWRCDSLTSPISQVELTQRQHEFRSVRKNNFQREKSRAREMEKLNRAKTKLFNRHLLESQHRLKVLVALCDKIFIVAYRIESMLIRWAINYCVNKCGKVADIMTSSERISTYLKPQRSLIPFGFRPKTFRSRFFQVSLFTFCSYCCEITGKNTERDSET